MKGYFNSYTYYNFQEIRYSNIKILLHFQTYNTLVLYIYSYKTLVTTIHLVQKYKNR